MTRLGFRPETEILPLVERYRQVRSATERLCEPLGAEDCMVQSMADVSPTKWHLAHVSWFFETFVLKPGLPGYRPRHPDFEYLFNSYYDSVGAQFSRPRRGLLSRPTLDEVYAYRAHVDEAMHEVLERAGEAGDDPGDVVELGLHHEQQHQELLLMDIKHVFSCNPLHPAYCPRATWPRSASPARLDWIDFEARSTLIGHEGPGFSYDNERPRHQVYLAPFRLASRLVTNGEYLEFMDYDGYRRSDLWLADGWTTVQAERWNAPLYWVRRGDEWLEFSLAGLRPLDPNAPVCHVSYFEADAFASWAGARLPSEMEWEAATVAQPIAGNFLEQGLLHPRPAGSTAASVLRQLYGDVWEWTRSAYGPYPGYRPVEGALGEYNGKFMCGQYVMRGGASVTPRSHIRPTYRNFFYPHCRWQFSGIRLARDA